jgi:hypothetical protein
MRRLAVFVGLLTLASGSFGAIEVRPKGTNCDLAKPPESAGEEMSHGVTLRIYPRAKDIGPAYRGCQSLWAPAGDRWTLVSMVEIVKGDPVRVWSSDSSERDITACRFKGGRVVRGDPSNCPSPNHLILKSLAPGCVEMIREAVSKGGIGIEEPAGCGYE